MGMRGGRRTKVEGWVLRVEGLWWIVEKDRGFKDGEKWR